MSVKRFYVDFSGYCEIEAETKADAERIFWEKLPSVGENDVWEIEGIEEKEDTLEKSMVQCTSEVVTIKKEDLRV